MPDECKVPSAGVSHRLNIDGTPVKVSLVTTFRNEEDGIENFLDSIFGQSRLPDELVLVDGGSSDRTLSLVEEYTAREVRGVPVRLIVDRGSNISAGRNRGIREASHEVLAVTDAGCSLEKDWLQCIVTPIERDPGIDIVAGSYRVDAEGLWERVSCAYLMYGFPTQTLGETLEALETIRGLFDEGSLHSAYWHRFALTAHSDMACHPERYGIRLAEPHPAAFARNEIPFEAGFDHDLEQVGAALKAATYNYNLGVGYDIPVTDWLDG